jgi:hypothetical protein
MTRLEEFVSALKLAHGVKALPLLAAIAVPGSAIAASLPAFPPTTITQQAEDTARVSTIPVPDTDAKLRGLQEEADLLAKDAFRFLESVRTNPAYAVIYSQQLSPVEKLELVKSQLDIDMDRFNTAINQRYSDLAMFNDPTARTSFGGSPDFSSRVERISETIEGIRDVMSSFRQTTKAGANRADQNAILELDIRIAQARLASVILAIHQRYERPKGAESNSISDGNQDHAEHRANGFQI